MLVGMIKAWRWCGWVALCWWGMLAAGLARAEAAPRLVLVDGADAGQLHRALEVSLEAWSFEVVDWPREAGAVDAAGISKRANARYVVWWDEGAKELVVHDEALGESERRELAAMPREEAEASALALSIKTMLRLSPASGGGAGEAKGREALVWLPAARLGPRFGLDGDSATQLRVQVGMGLRVAALGGVELGLLGEVGTETEVTGGNFRGDWAEWSVLATVGRAVEVKGWTVTGQVGGGVSRATLEGQAGREEEDAASVRACGQLSAIGLRALGPVQVGGALAVTARGSEQHFRANGQPLWQEPALLLAALAVVQVEL
jgi:hypothetical protein